MDQWDVVHLGEGLKRAKDESECTYGDELGVLGVVAVFGKHTDQSLSLIEGFANLIEAVNKTY